METVLQSWQQEVRNKIDSASILVAKLKNLRFALKRWSKSISNLNLLISRCDKVIGYLDALEEGRLLTQMESNLRNIIKKQLGTLLEHKKEYWKKRYTVNRVKLGDECTKFFHSMATISYRRNCIPQLMNNDGCLVHNHDSKAAILWNDFKARMGVTDKPKMLFDLSSLITRKEGLDVLTRPIEEGEITVILKGLPVDKAPGPDGFNGLFLKKCWPIIKDDFLKLCFEFFGHAVNIACLNTSYITLVPKVESPVSTSDFRPISLSNCSLKLITKIMANRL